MRVLLLALIAACGDGPGDQAVRGEATLETFVNRMCACSEPKCASTVVTDFAHWTKMMKKPRDNPDDAKRLMERYNACMAVANARTSR